MLTALRHWRRTRRLRSLDTTETAWQRAWTTLPLLHGLTAAEAARLRELAALLLTEKSIEPVQGLALSLDQQQQIALSVCLPILHLDLDWLAGWVSIVVHPDEFVAEFDDHDEHTGIVHHIREPRSGESWDYGPLVLSWADIEDSAPLDGYNVVVHEIAHKLDGLDGVPNGKPPLHRGMSISAWSRAFSAAYEALQRDVHHRRDTAIDPYGAEAPEEFFAVTSEAFFETPHVLRATYPAVYEQLSLFYRQDPAARLSDSAT